MSRKRKGSFISKRVNIPQHIVAQIDLTLFDRSAGSYGLWSTLITELLERYLKELKSNPNSTSEASNEKGN